MGEVVTLVGGSQVGSSVIVTVNATDAPVIAADSGVVAVTVNT